MADANLPQITFHCDLVAWPVILIDQLWPEVLVDFTADLCRNWGRARGEGVDHLHLWVLLDAVFALRPDIGNVYHPDAVHAPCKLLTCKAPSCRDTMASAAAWAAAAVV